MTEGTKQVATLVNNNAPWTAKGGEGIVYSSLTIQTLTVANSGPVTLTFSHDYSFEDGFDGGAVYVSVNGAAPAYVPAGQETFTGKLDGYDSFVPTESVVNLGALAAGDTVAVGFRGGWDDASFATTPNWEIFSLQVKDSTAATLMDADFLNGPAGFKVAGNPGPDGSWTYPGQSSEFEINGDTLAADRYVPDTPGATTIIDLNESELPVVLLDGSLDARDTFSLFDLSGGTTLRGGFSSI